MTKSGAAREYTMRFTILSLVSCALLPLATHAAEGTLDEIVVTAQRRVERLQDVPLAITALSGADLAEHGVRQAGDITAGVPNMLLNSPYGPEAQPTFTLRGVTTQDYSQNQSSPIAMYVDEVYKPVGAVQALQVYDLDRVEVLRGPQGTLYGKNATGGAISFYSRNPSLSSYDGYLTVGGGNYSDYSARAAVGGPIAENELGWRVALLYEKRDGWVHSIVPGVEPLNGVDALAGRFTLLAKPSDTLTATLKVSFSRSGGTPYGAHALNNDPTATGFSGNIGWFDNGAKYAVHKDIRNDSVSLKLDWHETAGFGWLAGLYYGRESTHPTVQFHFFDGYNFGFWSPASPSVPQALYGFDEYNSFDQLKDSRAVFLNTTFVVAPKVTLRAGVRHTRDKVTISHFFALEGGVNPQPAQSGPLAFTPDGGTTTWWTQTIGAQPAPPGYFQTGLVPQGQGLVPEFGKDTNNVSGKIGVDWKPGEDLLAYASISQGYRGVAFNGQAYNAPAELTFAGPEKLTSYEVGLKTGFWNRRGVFNAALFHYDYKNQQFLDEFALPSGTGFRTVNAPKSRVDGAEFEFRVKATPDLEIGSTLGLMHSKYVDLTLHKGGCVVAGTGPNCAGGVPRICCVGNQLIQAPDYNASVDFAWRFAHIAGGDLRLFVNANFYGKQYFDAFNTERDAQGAYGVANARVSFESTGTSRPGFGIGVWVKNLANRQYLAYALNQKDADTGLLGFDYALVGEPRTYGVDVTLRF